MKESRGYVLRSTDGDQITFYQSDRAELFSASNTDAKTKKPLSPDPTVAYPRLPSEIEDDVYDDPSTYGE